MFNNKIKNFLKKANDKKIIDNTTLEKLNSFLLDNSKKSFFSNIVNIGYSISGVLIILGLILLISHNWHKINDLALIAGYLTILSSTFLSAVFIKNEKLSNILYIIASGFVLGGIGLVAQIFHLTSTNGTAYLIWGLLILPTAIVVKNKYLNLLTFSALFTWLLVLYISIIDSDSYFAIFPLLFSLIYLFSEYFKKYEYLLIKKLSFVLMGIFYFTMLLSNINNIEIKDLLNISPLFLAVFSSLTYLYIKSKSKDYIMLAYLTFMPFTAFLDTQLFKFLLNVSWIVIPTILIYIGAIKNESSKINNAMLLIFVYIMYIFFELIETMLFTGSIFTIVGLVLLILPTCLNKIRKKIILYGEKNAKKI